MYPYHNAPRLAGAEFPVALSAPGSRCLPDAISALRPIHAILRHADYWQLEKQKCRSESSGGFRGYDLGLLIRAKMADAVIVEDRELGPDRVTGKSQVTFTVNGCRPMTCALYHQNYPEDERRRLRIGSFLGISLMGMKAGQSTRLLDRQCFVRTLDVLDVGKPDTPVEPLHQSNPFV